MSLASRLSEDAIAHHRARLSLFRGENAVLTTRGDEPIVLLGDSLTEGFDVEAHFPGRLVVNRGIAGDRIGLDGHDMGMIHRVDPELLAANPTHVFVLAGINDIADEKGRVPHHLQKYRELLRRLRSEYEKVAIHCITLLPARGPHTHLVADVQEFNAGLAKLTREMGLSLVDLYRRVANPDGALRFRFARLDGLHLTRLAYAEYRRAIEREMGWPPLRGALRERVVEGLWRIGTHLKERVINV